MIDEPSEAKFKISPAYILILTSALIGIFIAMMLVLFEPNSDKTQQPVIVQQRPMGSLINQPAPDFILNNLEGRSVQLSDFRGRIVFLNFWASWCAPCRREMPVFAEFMAEQDDDGPLILTVNAGETNEQVQTFFDDIDVEGVLVVMDVNSTIHNVYGVAAMPTTFIIDEGGIVHSVKFGEFLQEDLYRYIAAINDGS